MKQYSILIVFLAFAFLAIPDGHSQTASVSKDVVIALDDSGNARVDNPELPLSKILSAILGSLSQDSRISFIVSAGKGEIAIPFTSVTDEGVGKKIEEMLSNSDAVKPKAVITVTIKRGDTLWKLADKYYGDPDKWPIILKNNRLPRRGDDLPVGTVIHIPNPNAKSYPRETRVKERLSIPMLFEKSIYNLKHNGRANAEKQIVLISDRPIDIRDNALSVERYRWLKDELAVDSKSAGIQIFSIALTEQVDFELMQSLAQKTDGGYYRVFKTEDIQIAISGMSKTVPIPETASEPEPQSDLPAAHAEMMPVKAEKEAYKGLLIAVLAAAGVVVLSVVVFVFMRGGKETEKSNRSPSIAGGAYLMDLSGATEKSNYAISNSIFKIGRGKSEDIDIFINKGTISGMHAQIEYKDNNFYLTDPGSTNGTYVNDEVERITDEVCLNAGDVISFDQYRFKLVVRGQGDPVPVQPDRSEYLETQDESSASESDTAGEAANASVRTAEDAAADKEVEDLEAYLVDASGITDKESHRISKRVTKIGRAIGNVDIHIDENTISGVHAQIEYKDHEFHLTDMGSRNGTYMNEERARITSEVPLQGNDTIYFDQYKFKFVVHKQQKLREAQLSASASEMVSG